MKNTYKTTQRFFYGYIIVAVAFLVMVLSWAVYTSFGVFFKPLQTEFGWTSAVTSGAFSLSMIIYGILGIVVGGLNDRFGPRLVITFCGFLLGMGYLLMSQTSTLLQLYLFYGMIVGIGMSGVWVPQLSTIARWFTKRTTLMTGIVIAGAGIGQLIGPPLITRLIDTYDWRMTIGLLGGISLITVILAAQFMKGNPSQTEQLPYGANKEEQPDLKFEPKDFSFKEAVNTPQFWIASLLFSCYGYAVFSIIVHIVPYTIGIQFSATDAANFLAIMGGAGIIGNYLLSLIADRSGNKRVFIIGYITISASLLWLIQASEIWMIYLFVVVFGFVFGGMGAAESPLTARLFGLRSHGLIYGVIHIGFTVGAALGPFVTGYLFDIFGNYQIAFLVCSIFGILGLILSLILRPTKRLGSKI